MPDKLQRSFNETLGEVRAWLEDLRTLGLDDVPVADLCELHPCPPGVIGLDRGGHGDCRQETLEEIRADLGECQRCHLCTARHQIIFGAGSVTSRLLFVGGVPSRGEESSGHPLADELFERILFSIGFSRSTIYACQVVMCRPQQRQVRPEEISACLPFLHRQIAVVAPKVIVALGEVATRALTAQTEDFSALRGRWATYQGIDVMPTFDPAHLVLHPQEKREVWNDLKEVLRKMRADD